MSYDWTKHVKADRMNRRPGGVEASGRVFMGKAAPQGLRLTPQFYLNWAFDNVMRALSYADVNQRGYILDLLDWFYELDEEITYLTAYQRRDYLNLEQPSPAPSMEE